LVISIPFTLEVSMARSSDSEKVLAWQERLSRFQTAGLPVIRFCQQEGVCTATFYRWRKKLAQRKHAPAAPDPSAFANVTLVATADVRVSLPGGTQLHVPTGDPHTLQAVLCTIAQHDAHLIQGTNAC